MEVPWRCKLTKGQFSVMLHDNTQSEMSKVELWERRHFHEQNMPTVSILHKTILAKNENPQNNI